MLKIAALVCLVIQLIVAQTDLHADDAAVPLSCNVKKEGLDAKKFFMYFTKDTPYTFWKLWPGKDKLFKGGKPHGVYLTTYLNPIAYRSISNKDGMAVGSIIVTENYDDRKRLRELSVMMKIKGYNPEAGDWHWFQYQTDGKTLSAGRTEGCINCHGTKKENSYIMTAPVR